MKRTIGTCYYPEHWPEDIWSQDAQRMVEAGLTWVRIGEFAWTRLEPSPGQYDFDWLDRAITVLGDAGLRVVLGTPTATPPRWMIDKYPDMIAIDRDGKPRKFGSRRHYCFSHLGYQAECARIVKKMAQRYGTNPHIAAWQTDNEYGCHDTTLSYSDAARTAFQAWLRKQFATTGNDGDIGALNAAWGNVFWSMDYANFDQIDLPNLTVTEPNPSHSLAFRQFSSDQVVAFNKIQVDIIRQYSNAPIAHNYMGRITDFDHFKVGECLDIASWDSYPLGFLEDRVDADEAHKAHFAKQGDPDFQAFHHDLYRAVGRGRWWIMEQQPGPVNWAPYNPAPLAGMVRLWSWEAFAHGAEAVCYFRWRQAPMAQEQMHAGLLRPDSADAPALAEARQVAQEIANAPAVSISQAPVAIIFDYNSDFAWSVQPHGKELNYFSLVFQVYRALRSLGLSIDILPPSTRDFTGYKMVFVPGMIHVAGDLIDALASADARVIYGPRTAARGEHLTIPTPLPPQITGLDVTVSYVESLRPSLSLALKNGGQVTGYFEHLETSAVIEEQTTTGCPAVVEQGHQVYVAGWFDHTGWRALIRRQAAGAGLSVIDLPDGLRCRDTRTERFWINYDTQDHHINGKCVPAISYLREDLEAPVTR